jgi:CMP/dCMP kinase
MIIAVDGPAASGKGTLAAGLAAHYRLPHLDTGLLYRAVGLAVRGALDTPGFESAAIEAAGALDAASITHRDELQTAEAGSLASKVAVIAEVRVAMRKFQREFAAQPGGAVLDGRDIGTVVCPDADVKLYVTASPEARALRRHQDAPDVSYDDVLADIARRDARDMGRTDSPLKPAADAHLLDTTQMDIEAAFQAAKSLIDDRLASRTKS